MNNHWPRNGILLPRRWNKPIIPELRVLSSGNAINTEFSHRAVMQGRSSVAALEEPSRCPLLPKHRRPGPLLTDAVPRKANAAVRGCKLPPLAHTPNLVSSEYPVTHTDENSDMAVDSHGHPQKLCPLLVEESNTPASSLKKVKKVTLKDVTKTWKAVQQSTELITNENKPASNQDVTTRKPQPPSKLPIRKSGLRTLTKKMSAASALQENAHAHCRKLPPLNIDNNFDIEDVSDGHLQTLSPLLVEESIMTASSASNREVMLLKDLRKEDVPPVKGSQKAVKQSTEQITDEKKPASNQDVATKKPQPPSKLPVRKTSTLNKKMAQVAANGSEPASTCSFGDSRSKPEEIWERRRAARRRTTSLLPRRMPRAKVPDSSRVSRSPALLLIAEVDERSPSNSKASSPVEAESSTTTVQPRPPAGPRSPRRPNNRLTRPRSQSTFGFRAYEEDETEEDEQDRQILEAMLMPWFRSKSGS
ncbi:uncharacterized protein LOC134101154 [Sardina pilchardus]|uniref:uncharacterized protein LOC134101154 n=1 Tax=Sardina pilchardus TaxID=27697 RepID=UPI002E0F444C